VAGNDVNGHGTHTAGTIAAASGRISIVASRRTKIATSSRATNGFFFPEMVVCAYVWVATHGIDVTNNSYFADPWLFNCKNDPEQRAIWFAEQRALGFAQSRGDRRRRLRRQRQHRPLASDRRHHQPRLPAEQ
jgi:subtilisin family serine protease